MKKILSVLIMALVSVTMALAQQIAVVSPSGSTSTYYTFQEAMDGASSGSTVYLPGGGFKTNDYVIKKKLTIIGVGYRVNADNAEGATMLEGNLQFEQGADGSALMGVHLSGRVSCAKSDGYVNDILIKYCDVGSIYVYNPDCSGIEVNQCYVRGHSKFGYSSASITNNVIHSIEELTGGLIDHNIVTNHGLYGNSMSNLNHLKSCTITNNFLFEYNNNIQASLPESLVYNNCSGNKKWGEDYVLWEGSWEDLFVDPTHGISPSSDFHFKSGISFQGSDLGIYGGSGFNDSGLPPVPYISFKSIPDQTDAAGKLPIRVTVKAGAKK